MTNIYEFDDLTGFVVKAGNYVAYRYRNYGVERMDVRQEIFAWLYEPKNKVRVERWLASRPQQTTRIYRSMLDVGLKYGEKEKAETSGYRPDDVWWYTPSGVAGLLPLALDSTFTQANGHIGDLLTMVIDIRKAIQVTGLATYFADADEEDVDWTINIQTVIDHLGGERPAVGRRRVMSNAKAQALTQQNMGE